MIKTKTKEELETMRRAGAILAKILNYLRAVIRPGISTKELEIIADEQFQRYKVVSAFKGYKGFPASICTSINEEVVHGIPSERQLKEGDIISLDLGIRLNGLYCDMAYTQPVGKIKTDVQRLIDVTKESLMKGIKQARINNRVSDISYAVQTYVESNGFSTVRDFVGHGIGRQLHEEPQIPNFGRPNCGDVIREGMVFAIEPMVNMGTWEVEILENGWTAVTKDRKPSAHFEHTVAILESGAVILTQ